MFNIINKHYKRGLQPARNIVLSIKYIEKEECIFKFFKRVQFHMLQERDIYVYWK